MSESDVATYRVTVGNPSGQAVSTDAVVTYVPGIRVFVRALTERVYGDREEFRLSAQVLL